MNLIKQRGARWGKNVLPHLSDRRSVRRSMRLVWLLVPVLAGYWGALRWIACVAQPRHGSDGSDAATVGAEP